MFIYVLTCVFLFGLMGMLWGKKDWFNLLIKLVFVSMSFYGLALVWNDLVNLVNK